MGAQLERVPQISYMVNMSKRNPLQLTSKVRDTIEKGLSLKIGSPVQIGTKN